MIEIHPFVLMSLILSFPPEFSGSFACDSVEVMAYVLTVLMVSMVIGSIGEDHMALSVHDSGDDDDDGRSFQCFHLDFSHCRNISAIC